MKLSCLTHQVLQRQSETSSNTSITPDPVRLSQQSASGTMRTPSFTIQRLLKKPQSDDIEFQKLLVLKQMLAIVVGATVDAIIWAT